MPATLEHRQRILRFQQEQERTMHLNAKPPVFVPDEFQDEIEQLSKAALMDMVWDYALQIAGVDDRGIPQAPRDHHDA